MNFTKFTKWDKDTEGAGCFPDCYDFHGLALDMRAGYRWRAEQKEREYPYICVSDCPVGYLWQRGARRCVKIVDKLEEKKKQSEASVQCAKDNGRLLSINSCEELEELGKELWFRSRNPDETFWVGLYAEGFAIYLDQTRTSAINEQSINSRGQIGLQVEITNSNQCVNSKKIRVLNPDPNSATYASDFPVSSDGFFLQLVFPEAKKGVLKLHEFTGNDSIDVSSYLCENEDEWSCPDGYILFQEICYKFFNTEVSFASADKTCNDEGGKVVEPNTRLHQNFINAWLASEDFNFTKIWIGYRKQDTKDEYVSLSKQDSPYPTDIDFGDGVTNATPEEDCLVLFNDVWLPTNCWDEASVICEVPQTASDNSLFSIPQPELLMPLDIISGFQDYYRSLEILVMESQVAISYHPSTENMLKGAAHFLGRPNSFLDVGEKYSLSRIRYKYGITISMWIKIDAIDDDEVQYLVDGSAPCEDETENFNNFVLYLEKGSSSGSGLEFSSGEGCESATSGRKKRSGGAKYIKLVAVLCDGATADGGLCHTFESMSSTPIEEQGWVYIAFTYDPFVKRGTFVINDIYGYEADAGVSNENEYFTYDTLQWLSGDVMEEPIRLGSKKYPENNENSFAGKISCFQLYESFLKPVQIHHIKHCPLDNNYVRFNPCPSGYYLFRDNCYKIMSSATTFTEAELDCTTAPGKTSGSSVSIEIINKF